MRILLALLASASLAFANPLIVLGGSPPTVVSGAVTVTYIDDNSVAATTANPVIFSAENTGTAAADRISVVAIYSDGRSAITGVTINGITATLASGTNLTNYRCALYYAPNPTGTTGNISITYGNAVSANVAVVVYSVTGAAGAPSDTDTASGTGVASLNMTGLTIPASGGAIIAGTNSTQGTAVTWTNATESTDFSATSFRASGATTTTAGTPTITLDGATDDHLMAGAAWAPAGAFSPIALIANTGAGASDGAFITTSSINTTGASLLVVAACSDGAIGAPTLSDSKANTWTPLTEFQSGGNGQRHRLYYAANPTVGSGHTFTFNGPSNCRPTVVVAAFSNVLTVSPFDQQNGAMSNGSSTVSPGSVTPTTDNQLVVSGVMSWGHNPVSVGSSFITTDLIASVGGGSGHVGGGLAYKVQTTAGAENPTWTLGASNWNAATIATFKHQ